MADLFACIFFQSTSGALIVFLKKEKKEPESVEKMSIQYQKGPPQCLTSVSVLVFLLTLDKKTWIRLHHPVRFQSVLWRWRWQHVRRLGVPKNTGD